MNDTRSIPTRRPVSAARGLIRLLWRQPLWAVPFALFFGTLSGGTRADYLMAYKLSLVFAYWIGFALWATHHLVGRLEKRGLLPLRPIWTGLYYVLAALLGSFLAATTIHFTLMPGFMGSAPRVVATGLFSLLFAALFTGINYAIMFHRQAVDRASAVERMRAELAQAELRALRAQIRPHFLFNTLNSIAALISSNPAAAEDMTTRLADIFRYALSASEREHARLADELAFLRAYLVIERTRFGHRLTIEEDIEPGLDAVLIPSLLLQPLVENAVIHGVSSQPEGGTVRIAARRDGDRLFLEVADDGPGFEGAPPSSGTGFGLHSVRERLRAAGLPDALEVDAAPGRGTRIRVSVPMTLGSQPSPGASS